MLATVPEAARASAYDIHTSENPRLGGPDQPDKSQPVPTDEVLMERFRAGEASAFRALVTRHENHIFNFVLRQVRYPETAHELVQETFLRVVKNADTFRAEARFLTWVFTIARNLCVDALRRQKHRNTVALDAPLRAGETGGATLLDMVKDDQPAADSRVQYGRFSAALRDALGALPPEQREVFLMRELEGLKFREIAEVVGVPENTIKSRMRYALEALRSRLSAYQET